MPLQLLVLRNQSETMKSFDLDEEYAHCMSEIEKLKRQHHISESQEELETQANDSTYSSVSIVTIEL